MSAKYRIETVRSSLQTGPGRVHKLFAQVVRKTAYDVKADTQLNIRALDLVDTGAMMNNVFVLMINAYSAAIVVGQHYGIYHELGTTRLPAQPFLGPAVESNKDSFYMAVGQSINIGMAA